MGCFADGDGTGHGNNLPRLLSGIPGVIWSNLTVENCQQHCASAGYFYAGVEGNSGDSCYCGNAIQSDPQSCGTCASRLDVEASCNKPCTGNGSETCGGNWYANIYPQSTIIYYGCFANGIGSTALLPAFTQTTSSTNTAESCLMTCTNGGYTYAGAQAGTYCYCGNAMANNAGNSRLLPFASCGTVCPGNGQESCGSSANMSVYTTLPTVNSIVAQCEWWIVPYIY